MKIKNKILELIKGSIIFCALDRFSAFLYSQLAQSIWGKLFTSYSSIENKFRVSCFAKLFKIDRHAKLFSRIRYSIAGAFEKNPILRFISGLFEYFLGCRLKVYGIFLLPFGIYTSLIYVVKRFAFYLETDGALTLYLGLGAVVLSFLLIPSKITLSQALEESVIMKAVLSDSLGVRMENLSAKKSKKGRSSLIFFVAGIVAGLLTLFVSPLAVVLLFFVLIALGIVFSYPEAGLLAAIFISPFIVFLPHPTLLLSGIVLLTTFSYIVKLIRGKRTFKVEFIDVIVIAFMGLMLFGGFVSVSPSTSVKPALIYFSLMLGYILVVNLMRTKLWLKRAVSVLVSSAALVSIYGIWQYHNGAVNENWIDPEMFSSISGRAISTFENPNMLAEYIILILPFAVAVFVYSQKIKTKLLYLGAAALMAVCLVYTWSRSAWLGILVGLLVFFLIYSRRMVYLLVVGAASIPFLPFVLPDTVIQRFTSIGNLADSSTSYRRFLWESIIMMIKDFFVGGIGVGEGAFKSLYPAYTYSGMEASPHSHSIYFQITLELGVIGILVFLFLVFLLNQSAFEYTSTTSDKRSKLMVAAGLSAVIAALVQGFAEYIWYNYRVFFVFWIVVAVICAYRRVGFEDEKVEYRRSDENTACLDVKLAEKTQ